MMLLLIGLLLQAETPEAILDRLDAQSRGVKTIHAEFLLHGLPQVSSITLDFAAGKQLHFVLHGDPLKPVEHYLLDGWKRYRWKDGEAGGETDFKPYMEGAEKGLRKLLESLGPDPAGGASSADANDWGFVLGIDLEGKPSKDEMGTLRFNGAYYGPRFLWLGLLREETAARPTVEGKTVVFDIPARRKTVVLDRDSGFVLSIKTVDYDGTVRSVECRSFQVNGALAGLPKIPACRKIPVSRQELEDIVGNRREYFGDLLSAVFRRWDRIEALKQTPAVVDACSREVESLTTVWREARLHQMAVFVIQRRLESGSSWKSLNDGESAETAAFLEIVGHQNEEDKAYLKARLDEFNVRLEASHRELAPKGTDASKFRSLLPSSEDFDGIWKRQLESTPARPAQVFAEELDLARQI